MSSLTSYYLRSITTLCLSLSVLLGSAQITLMTDDGATTDNLGRSVAISGDFAIVGADGDNNKKGAAYIFERQSDDSWVQVQKIVASDGVSLDDFGVSVSISGDFAIVGAFGDDDETGSAYIFAKDEGGPGNWGEMKKITASDGDRGDRFGVSVSISGDIAIVGADRENDRTGAAYIFAKDEGGPGNWGQMKKITASDVARFEGFGVSVSISGDIVIVGAPGRNSITGAAYIFAKDEGGPGNWGEMKKITASDAASGDRFGISVSISGDIAIVGAFGKNIGTGAAYIFAKDEGGPGKWGEVQKITASDGVSRDFFGNSVDISEDGDRVAVGAPGGGNGGAGRVYIFDLMGDGTRAERPDITPPAITAMSPVDGATDVDLSTPLTITFDEPIQKGTTGTMTLMPTTGNNPVITINITDENVSIDGNTVTIMLPQELTAFRLYDVAITPGTIDDVAGNGFAGIVEGDWSFTTGAPGGGDGEFEEEGLQFNDDAVTTASIVGVAAGDSTGYAVALSDDGTRLIVGSPFSDVSGMDSGGAAGFILPSPGASSTGPSSTIPTLSQWGLILLSLLILSIGAISLRQKFYNTAYQAKPVKLRR